MRRSLLIELTVSFALGNCVVYGAAAQLVDDVSTIDSSEINTNYSFSDEPTRDEPRRDEPKKDEPPRPAESPVVAAAIKVGEKLNFVAKEQVAVAKPDLVIVHLGIIHRLPSSRLDHLDPVWAQILPYIYVSERNIVQSASDLAAAFPGKFAGAVMEGFPDGPITSPPSAASFDLLISAFNDATGFSNRFKNFNEPEKTRYYDAWKNTIKALRDAVALQPPLVETMKAGFEESAKHYERVKQGSKDLDVTELGKLSIDVHFALFAGSERLFQKKIPLFGAESTDPQNLSAIEVALKPGGTLDLASHAATGPLLYAGLQGSRDAAHINAAINVACGSSRNDPEIVFIALGNAHDLTSYVKQLNEKNDSFKIGLVRYQQKFLPAPKEGDWDK